mgnify:CR=1 FL=1
MKSKDLKALHQQSLAELQKKLTILQQELGQARVKKQAGKLENTSSVKLLADDVARVKTIMKLKKA